uniref:SET and MYND domain-containing protein 4 n=2 Tax=Culex pipiens TaxID=7175 RepID=A0A8D8NWV6_CULPI
MVIMGPQGLTAAQVGAIWEERPLSLLNLDFVLGGPRSDDDYDAFDAFFSDHLLAERAPSLAKGNKAADRIRVEGNRFYVRGDYHAAMGKYNESICYAAPGSEQMAIACANRSAFNYEHNEFEQALVNIRLAKKHNYPERLMPKLLNRELSCKQKLAAGESKGLIPCPLMYINVETNPKIPFLAKGIHMEVLPDFDRSMVADRDFRTGDVILDEKCILAVVDAERRYHRCGHCSTEGFYSLIPCPHCVSVMYCSEKCLEWDWKYVHRFECAVSDKLQYISYGHVAMGSKLFLYGLSLFNDDLDEMMRYFETLEKSGGNALDLDYTEYDPLEEWKDLCNVKVVEPGIVFAYRNENFARLAGSAHCYMLLKNPAVAAIVNTPAKRTFMYQRVRDFVRLANFYKWESFSSPLCPVASLFNHSCDANAVATIHSDKIRIVVLRPIRAGEQICVSYGPSWWDKPDPTPYRAHFECKCVACDPEKYDEWRAEGREPPASFFKNAETAIAVLGDELANNAAKYNAITQLIEKYAYLHPQKNFAALLYKHQESLRTLIDDEDGTYHRTIAHAKLEEEDE